MANARALTGDVLVIGAGPAGLASAHYLQRAGIAYTVVDRASEVASTWAGLYRSLRLNTASFVTYLPGQRMPIGTPIYPSGEQLYRYLVDYARRGNFHLCMDTEVKRVAPAEGGWRVESSAGERIFPCVICASGRFGQPIIPPVPGLGDFRGRVLHARDYHTPQPFAGQRVLVVGAGPSGVDIALELAGCAATPVALSVRHDMVVARRYPYGLPDTAWHLIARSVLPRAQRKPFLDRVLFQPFPDAAQSGVPMARNRTDRRGTSTPVRGRAILDAFRSGIIQPVAGIARFEPDAAVTDAGERIAADVVIMATGYRPDFRYLEIRYETDTQGYPLRADSLDEGGSTEVLGHPGLYMVGRYYRGLGPLNNIRHEARTAVAEIQAWLSALARVGER
jgi:putative flavoprotein involved in K+ transport